MMNVFVIDKVENFEVFVVKNLIYYFLISYCFMLTVLIRNRISDKNRFNQFESTADYSSNIQHIKIIFTSFDSINITLLKYTETSSFVACSLHDIKQ